MKKTVSWILTLAMLLSMVVSAIPATAIVVEDQSGWSVETPGDAHSVPAALSPARLSESEGTTYYVSLSGKAGNAGTLESAPFPGLRAVPWDSLESGDKVLLKRGDVFDGYIQLVGRNGVTIGAYGTGDKPVINAAGQGVWYQDSVAGYTGAVGRTQGYVSSAVLLYDCDNVTVQDLEVTNSVPDEAVYFQNSGEVTTDTMDRTGVAVVAKEGVSSNITVQNVTVHDVTGNPQDTHMANGGIYFTVLKPASASAASGFENVLVDRCEISDVTVTGIGLSVYTGGTMGAGVTVSHNYVLMDKGEAVRVPDGVTLTDNDLLTSADLIARAAGFSSDVYTVDYSAKTVVGVAVNSAAADILANFTPLNGAQLELVALNLDEPVSGTVSDDVRLKVTKGVEVDYYYICVRPVITGHTNYDRTGWTATAGSHQDDDSAPGNVLDGSTSTLWHSVWQGSTAAQGWIMLDMKQVQPVSKVIYTPRQNTTGHPGGKIYAYELWVGTAENSLTKVAEGRWMEKTDANKYYTADQEIVLSQPVNARFVKLVATDTWTNPGVFDCSATEINVAYPVYGVPAAATLGESVELFAASRTYYVSARTGSDSNSGLSAETPFYSLAKVNSLKLSPGDEVLLERGSVWTGEALTLRGQRGTAAKPILIGAYGTGAKPQIDAKGQGVWYQNYRIGYDGSGHNWRDYVSSAILLYDCEYIEVENLSVTNWGGVNKAAQGQRDQSAVVVGELDGINPSRPSNVENTGGAGVSPDPRPYYNYGLKMARTGLAVIIQNIGTADHTHIKNIDVENVYGNIYDKHLANGGIYVISLGPLNQNSTGVSRYNDLLVEGCYVKRVSRWGIGVGCSANGEAVFNAGQYVISDANGKLYGGTGLVVRGNYVEDAGGDPITVFDAYRPIVEYNVAYAGCTEMTPTVYTEWRAGRRSHFGRVAAGIWPWKCKSALFRYNECYGLLNADDTANGAVAEGVNGDGMAWDADAGDSTIYEYNYSSGNTGGCIMFCWTESYNSVFRYNISYLDGTVSGANNRGPLDLSRNINGKIYNNTFVMKEGQRVHYHNSGPSHVENNIFYAVGTAASGQWSGLSNAVYNNNLVINFTDTPAGSANTAASAWSDVFAVQPAGPTAPLSTGKGAAQTNSNGLCVGWTHDWATAFESFKLKEGSPAAGTGREVSLSDGLAADHGVWDAQTDFYGTPLGAAVSRGAHQAAGAAQITLPEEYSASVQQTGGVTGGNGWYLDTDGIDAGAKYVVYFDASPYGKGHEYDRAMYNKSGGSTVDYTGSHTLSTDEYGRKQFAFANNEQYEQWLAEANGDGIALKGTDSGTYVNLTTATNAKTALGAAQALTVTPTGDGHYTVSRGSNYLSVHNLNAGGTVYFCCKADSGAYAFQFYKWEGGDVVNTPIAYAVSTAGLSALVDEVKALTQADWTEESWAALRQKLTAAETALAGEHSFSASAAAQAHAKALDAAAGELYAAKLALVSSDTTQHTVSFRITGSYFTDDTYESVSGLQGAPLTLPQGKAHANYTFSGWSQTPTTIPGSDLELTGSYTYDLDRAITAENLAARPVSDGTPMDEPFDAEVIGVKCFRIPGFITLPNGWLVASADARWVTWGDSPCNIDTVVSISKDGGQTWNWDVVNYAADVDETVPGGVGIDNAAYGTRQAGFIDPAIAVDSQGKVYMVADAMGARVGGRWDATNPSHGGESTGFDDQHRLVVAHVAPGTDAPTAASAYTYYVDLEGSAPASYTVKEPGKADYTRNVWPICAAADDSPVGILVDAFLDQYILEEDGFLHPIYVNQKTDASLYPTYKPGEGNGKLVKSNLFYLASQWRTYPTPLTVLRTATVQGDSLVWDDPRYLDMKHSISENLLYVGPGRGIAIDTGDGDERVIFCMYDNGTGTERASTIYSDDHGATWQRGFRTGDVSAVGKVSESQLVELPDGTLRMFSRDTANYVAVTDSTDGGITWGATGMDTNLFSDPSWASGCMVSFINLEGVLIDPEGNIHENLLMGSYSRIARRHGIVRIGSVDARTNEITWLNPDETRFGGVQDRFTYSCITQEKDSTGKPLDKFHLLYEDQDQLLTYATVTTADLLGENWQLVAQAPSQVHSVALSQDLLELEKGDSGLLTATSSAGSVTWASEDPSIATVEGGTVTAVAAGSTWITATVTVDGVKRVARANVVVHDGATVTLPECYRDPITKTTEELKVTYTAPVDGLTRLIAAVEGENITQSMCTSGWDDFSAALTAAKTKTAASGSFQAVKDATLAQETAAQANANAAAPGIYSAALALFTARRALVFADTAFVLTPDGFEIGSAFVPGVRRTATVQFGAYQSTPVRLVAAYYAGSVLVDVQITDIDAASVRVELFSDRPEVDTVKAFVLQTSGSVPYCAPYTLFAPAVSE